MERERVGSEVMADLRARRESPSEFRENEERENERFIMRTKMNVVVCFMVAQRGVAE